MAPIKQPKGQSDDTARLDGNGVGPVDAEYVTTKYHEGARELRSAIQDYWLNHAFIRGDQWLWYNTETRRLDRLPRDDDRVQATMNMLLPATRTILSKLLQRELTFEVAPNAADDATIQGAATAESVVEAIRVAHNWEAIRTDNAFATWKAGTAAICVDWDPQGGSPITELTAQDNTNPATADYSPVFEGDTVETSLSLAEFVIEPGTRDPERARWWIKARAMPVKEVQAAFKLKDTPAADASSGVAPFQERFLSFGYGTGGSTPPDNLVMVYTYYERPSNLRAKGAVATVVNNQIVDGGVKPWPFPFKDKLNLVVTYETQQENEWIGATALSEARDVQVLYNAAWSAIIEHMKLAGNARLAVPASSVALMEQMTDMPGEMLQYMDGQQVPTWISPPTLPDWITRSPDQLLVAMDNILGVHDISKGEAPNNIQSGFGLSVLAEQDSTPVGKMVRDEVRAWGRVATIVLELYAAMVKSPRQAKIVTPSMPPETVNWTGQDLQGQTRATVPLDAVMPRSHAALFQAATQMMQMGVIHTTEEFTTIAELPGQKDILERMAPDIAKARRENASMALSRVEIPAVFDDHAKHITEHNVFRKSARFDRLAPEVQQVVADHIKAHEVMAAEAMGKAVAGAGIHPALAAVPDADGGPSLTPGELPPGAVTQPIPDESDAPGAPQPPGDEAEVDPATAAVLGPDTLSQLENPTG